MRRRLFHPWPVLAPVLIAIGLGCGGGAGSGSGAGAAGGAPAGADSSKDQIVLARIGDKVIPAVAVKSQMIETMGPDRGNAAVMNPDMLQVALAALVDQYVWAAKAESEGFHLRPEEQAQVDDLYTRLLATRYLGEVINKQAEPSREMVEEWYHDHQENYLKPAAVGVRHILVATEAEAEALRKQAEGGANFADLARKNSLDETTRDIGGALGMITSGGKILGFPGDGRSSSFEAAALPLEEGKIAVAETQLGWHVIKCEKREGGGLKPLDEVYNDIAKAMARRDFATIYNDELYKAREKFHAEIDEQAMERFTGVTHNVDRLLSIAESHPDPGGRIELYRRVVFDFPGDEHAPYAQFMIAYLNLVELNDSYSARKALNQLAARYKDSEWHTAGEYLRQYLDPNMTEPGSGHRHREAGQEPAPVPPDLGGPQDVLRKATQGK